MKKQTLFENEFEDEFLKGFSKGSRPITKTKLLEGYFYVFSSKEKKYYMYYFELHDHYIFCKKDATSEEIAYMNIANSFMKLTHETTIENESHTGIKFIKKNSSYFDRCFLNDCFVINSSSIYKDFSRSTF